MRSVTLSLRLAWVVGLVGGIGAVLSNEDATDIIDDLLNGIGPTDG